MLIYKGKISVIMPAHNEGHHIYENLYETYKVFKKAKCNFEIILVDDGSKDDTYIEAQRAAKEFENIMVLKHHMNGGKGNALKNGFNYTSGDFIVFLDSDLELHPNQLYGLFRIMRDRKADVIIGSKHHPKSMLNYPTYRKIISRIYALFLKILFNLPLRDIQTGLKIFSREVLDKVFPKVLCKRFAFDVELLANAHHLGYKIAEAPVVITYRREVKWGRIGLKTLYLTGIDTLAIFYRMYILRYYDGIEKKKDALETDSMIKTPLQSSSTIKYHLQTPMEERIRKLS